MHVDVPWDLIGVTDHSDKLLDTLKSRYPCFYDPVAAAAAATETPDDRRYFTSLWVFKNRQVDGPESPLPSSFFNLMVDRNIIDQHMIKEKITAVLKALKFRQQHVLVQFWSPVALRKRWLLTTWDQPFGLGVADKELYSYRLKSERRAIVVDAEYSEKLGPPGRVYCQKLPEWSLDIHGKDTCYNISGYINLPVFESGSDCCKGVLEIITSSSYVDFAFEVQEVTRALKKQNLKSINVFEDPSFNIADDKRRNELDQIFKVLKTACDTHNLPLAQTWAPSGHNSYVANSQNLVKSCSSFSKSCVGKACMSTFDLPFYVRDLNRWEFHEACREIHLHKCQGVVGRSLSSCGTSFCEDVTELDEDAYPLVHIARMNGLTSCLAIYLKSVHTDFEHVIEFFLPAHSANETELRRLMETVMQQIKNSSWMQVDIISPPQVIGAVSFSWNIESPPSLVNLMTESGEVVTPPESENMDNEPSNSIAGGTSRHVVPHLGKIEAIDISPGKSRSKRKRKDKKISFEDVRKHFGKTMDEAAAILNMSRSTLKRICRNLGIQRWPYRNGPDNIDADTLMMSDQTDIVLCTSEGAPITYFGAYNEVFGGTAYITHDPSSTNVPHQHEQAILSDECGQPKTIIKGNCFKTVGDVKIKVAYGENTIKFKYCLLDGLIMLEELVATRFQLRLGSFRLNYVDKDGNMVLIACDNDLKEILGDYMQTESMTVIKLFLDFVASQSCDALPVVYNDYFFNFDPLM